MSWVDKKYLQLTATDTIEINFFFSVNALFQTSQRNLASSSSFDGTKDSVAVVGCSREPPFFRAASKG